VVVGDILQPSHLLFVLVIALLVLGPKRLPEVGRSLGRTMRDFRSAVSGHDTPEQIVAETTPETTASAPTSEPTAATDDHPTEPVEAQAAGSSEHPAAERQPTPTR
jgi:sec-independent protein translocase protein TatA